MIGFRRAAIAGLASLAMAHPALAAAPASPLPVGTRIGPFSVLGGTMSQDGADIFGQDLKLSGSGLTLDISRLRVSPGTGGGWIIQLDGATARPRAAGMAGDSLTIGPSTLKISSSATPDCPIAQIRGFNISRGAAIVAGKGEVLSFSGFSAALPDAGSCLVGLDSSLARLALKQVSGGQVTIDQIALEGSNIPLSNQATQHEGESALKLSAGAARFQLPGMPPTWTFGALEATAEAATPGLAGLFQTLASLRPLEDGPGAPELRLMQFYNSATMLDAKIHASAADVGISAVGAVPAAMVADFARAGLSSMNGTGSIDLQLAEGGLSAQTKLRIVGVADLGLDIEGDLTPYGREKIALGASRKPLGYHLIPTATVSRATFSFLNTGFHSAAMSIFGVSAPIYLDGLAGSFETKGGAENALIAASLKRAAYFLRRNEQSARRGETDLPTLAMIAPDPPASLISILLAALSPSAKNVTKLNFSLSP